MKSSSKPNKKRAQYVVKDPYVYFFKAMSSKTRIEIIRVLGSGPMCVGEIHRSLGFKQSRVSRNLECLARCGFVKSRRSGKQMIYSLNDETIRPIIELIDVHMKKYCDYMESCPARKRR